MITEILLRLAQLVGLFLLQLLVCSHIHLWGYATPLPFVALLLYVGSDASRVVTLLAAFLLGMMTDIISSTPGVGAASMTLVAMLQPALLRFMAPRDAGDILIPGFTPMGRNAHLRYMAAIIGIHQVAYFTLDFFSFHHFTEFLLTLLTSFLLTYAVVWVMETIRDRRYAR